MKRLAIVILAIAGLSAQAQTDKPWGATAADSVKCWENLQIAGSYYNDRAYDQAFDSWYQLYTTCPGASKNTYIIAPKIIETRINNETDEAKKAELVDMLIAQYDDRLKYFYEEEKAGIILSDKAADFLKYKGEELDTAYVLFRKAFEVASKDMYPSHMNGYFMATVRMFNEKKIEIDELLDVYNFITDALDFNIIRYDNEIDAAENLMEKDSCDSRCQRTLDRNKRIVDGYNKVQGNIEKMLAPVLSCDKLNLVYTSEKFEANKENVRWLYTASKMLAKERVDEEGNESDCTDNPLYFDISEALYALEPSAQAARNLAKIAYKKKDYRTAAKYFEEAANLEADSRVKGQDLLKVAGCNQKLGALSTAKSYALQAAKVRRNWGDPYIMIAGIYADAAGSCGSNAVEKNAVYWLAIDKLNYAMSIDENVRNRANKLIGVYKNHVPDKSTAFALGYKEGDKVSVGCWISETAVVKFYQ